MEQMPENISGLAQPEAQPQTAVARAMPAPDADTPPEGMEAASPEEQAVYEGFVAGILNVLYSEGVGTKMIDSVRAAKDPKIGVASVTAALISKAAAQAKSESRNIPTEVIISGTVEIAEAVMEAAEEAGAGRFTDDPQMAQGAVMRAIDQTREKLQAAGLIDKAEMDEDFAELQQADKAGTLAESMRNPRAGQTQPEAEPEAEPQEQPKLSRQQRRRAAMRAKKQGGAV